MTPTTLADDNSKTYSVIIMIRTQISLEEDMYREAQREARRQGISFAELCRRALAQVLGHRALKEPWMGYAGAVNMTGGWLAWTETGYPTE